MEGPEGGSDALGHVANALDQNESNAETPGSDAVIVGFILGGDFDLLDELLEPAVVDESVPPFGY